MSARIPEFIEHYEREEIREGCRNKAQNLHSRKGRMRRPGEGKVFHDLSALLRQLDLKDGMTVSFHHHLRNGDRVLPWSRGSGNWV